MTWYKDVCYEQDKFIPISSPKKILPGMFEYMLSYLIDLELCPGVFDMHYNNDGQADHDVLKPHRDVYIQPDTKQTQREPQAVKSIKTKAKRLQRWLNDNNDNLGKGKLLRKKNITDNESARMKTSKDIIQAHYV